MKRLRNYSLVLASFAWLFVGRPVYAAADTGNAVQDILLSDRFNGAMSSIQWLTNIIDVWFIRIITITAFFIISSAVFKNVAAGAVCAFPKFWRRVHEAHERHALGGLLGKFGGLAKGLGKGGAVGAGTGAAGGGSIGDFLFALIPDFMALTEFADTDISPKQYFIKAIPEMIAAVCIGIFIYNGLYRDTLATVGTAGSNIVSNVLAAADPDKVTHFIFNNIKEPNNSFKKDTTIQGKWIYAISQQMYIKLNAASTTYSATEEDKQYLMGVCEQKAQSIVRDYSEKVFVATDSYYYKMSTPTVQLLTVTPQETVMPQDDNLYFSITVPLTELIPANDLAGDRGLAQYQCLQIACNFSVAARNGETVETQIQAIQGTLGGNAAGSLPVKSVTITADNSMISGDSGSAFLSVKEGTGADAIHAAIWSAIDSQLSASDGIYGHDASSMMYIDKYGQLGTPGVKEPQLSKGANTFIITVHYTYQAVDEDGQATGQAIAGSSKVTVIVNYN